MTEGFEEFLRARREGSERTRRLLIGVLAGTCVALAAANVFLAFRLMAGRAAVGDARARSAAVTQPPAGDAGAPPARVDEPRARAGGSPGLGSAPSAASPSIPSASERAPAVTLPKLSDSAPTEQAEPSAATPAEPRSVTPTEPRTARPTEPRGAAPRAEPPRAAPPRAEPRTAQPPVDTQPRTDATAPRVANQPSLELPPRSPATNAPPAAAPAAPMTREQATVPVAREEATATWMLETYGRDAAEERAQAALAFYDAQSPEGRYWRRVLALIVSSR
jgi:hypothetical protein